MRRTSTEGVWQLRPGLYMVRVKWKDAKTGKWREKRQRVEARSTTEANAKRLALKVEAEAGRALRASAPAALPFASAATSWLRSIAPRLAASTKATYATALDAWIEAFDGWLVTSITPEDVRTVLAVWATSGLTAPTRNGRLRVLRTFARANRCTGIVEGVVAAKERKRKKALSVEEVRAYTKHVHRGGWWAPLLATLAWTGARFGEASALRWTDVDLERGLIRIERAQYRGKIKATKTDDGVREIAIPVPLVKVLREHRVRLLKRQDVATRSELAFPSTAGTLAGQATVWRASRRVAKLAGIDILGRPALHAHRHTMHNLLRRTTSEPVREALIGHAGAASGEAYDDVAAEEKRQAAAKVVAMIGRRR